MIEQLTTYINSLVSALPLTEIVDGTVTSLPPEISVRLANSDIELDASQLIVSERFLSRTLLFDTDAIEQSGQQSGPYSETWIRGSVTLASTLELGDTVLMIRAQGGQKFYILDRGVSFGSDT